jgi:hypothetical protein
VDSTASSGMAGVETTVKARSEVERDGWQGRDGAQGHGADWTDQAGLRVAGVGGQGSEGSVGYLVRTVCRNLADMVRTGVAERACDGSAVQDWFPMERPARSGSTPTGA